MGGGGFSVPVDAVGWGKVFPEVRATVGWSKTSKAQAGLSLWEER